MTDSEQRINLLVTGGCGFIGSNFINHVFASNKYHIVKFEQGIDALLSD